MSESRGESEPAARPSGHAALQASAMAQWLTPTSQSRIEKIGSGDIDERPWPVLAAADESMIALRRSVSQRGVIEPLLLRPIPGGRLEVVLGARRLRVARELALATVPAIVRELSDSEAAVLAVWSILPRLTEPSISAIAAHLAAAGVADGEIALLLAASHPAPAQVAVREAARTFASSTPLRFATLVTPVSRLVDALGPARSVALTALHRIDTAQLDLIAS